jgi:tRNA (adenine57-N1/adenine58-N1)-methyltransferase
MLELATRNLNRAGLTDFVELKQRDIAAGFDEREVDAIFLDVREPWRYLDQVKETLKDGGCFGAILVTTNQVSDLLAAMTSHHPTVHPNRAWVTADQMQSGGFVEVEACEILLRSYKPVPERLRPVDRMVAHTGYLVFAHKIGSDGLSILESESQQAQPTDELLPMMEPQEISDESATGGNDV